MPITAFQSSFFGFSVTGLKVAYFTSVSGLSVEFDLVEDSYLFEGHKMMDYRPGPKQKYTELGMKRGFSTDTALSDWFNEMAHQGKYTPKDAVVTVHDRLGAVKATFEFFECWPSKLSVSDLSAGGNEVLIEDLTLQVHEMRWA